MLLYDLTKNYNYPVEGENVEIKTLYSFSKKRVEGGLFFCLNGDRLSGEDFVSEAEKFGAVAIVAEKKLNTKLSQVIVDDVRLAYSTLCAEFYHNPQKKLKIIGLVGTNGKTSTCKILETALSACGKRVGVIGTNGCFFEGRVVRQAGLTTPDPEDMFAILSEMLSDGAEFVVTEVSAHAIKLKKVMPIPFYSLIFTNCTEDHLDFFKDMDAYKKVKKSVFFDNKCKYKIVNVDDPTGNEIRRKLKKKVYAFGIEEPSDVFATMITESIDGTCFFVNAFDKIYEIKTGLLGKFNVYNVLGALCLLTLMGLDEQSFLSAINGMKNVEGRMQKIAKSSGADVFVDYAHTPDGLEKVLTYLKSVAKNRLIVLFGCGGNREKLKRPIMGRVAGSIADFVVVTSDNPRYEDADMIISDVEKGVREVTKNYITIKDRFSAIDYALKMLGEGDCLLIAGKGAENYQEVMGVKREFSDQAVVKRILGIDV